MSTAIPVDTTDIPKSVVFFAGLSELRFASKLELFKHAILKHEVPRGHLEASDYAWLQSRVASYHELFDGHIDLVETAIINKAQADNTMVEVSELVGVACGIGTAVAAFGVNPEMIERIPRPKRKTKYLDYWFAHSGQRIEFETKGTTAPSISRMVTDIKAKKTQARTPAFFRYGTVAVLGKPSTSHASKLYVCDDEPLQGSGSTESPSSRQHYLAVLEYIVDSMLYNRLATAGSEAPKRQARSRRSFFGRYHFDGAEYVGEFFDRRLTRAAIEAVQGLSLEGAYSELTGQLGKVKIFLGLRRDIFETFLQRPPGPGWRLPGGPARRLENRDGTEIFVDTDGVLIVVARNGSDSQVEDQFTEKEVRRRLSLGIARVHHAPPECGSPCRSREKEGKSCAIKTYRGTCAFHL